MLYDKSMRRFKYYDLILALFAAVLLISNISATKVVSFGPIITDGGAVLFPITSTYSAIY